MDCTKEQAATMTKVDDQNQVQRRSANYKPNIWKYDLLQALKNEYTEERYALQADNLKEGVRGIFLEAVKPLEKLELIDSVGRLGLASLFEKEIKEALDTIVFIEDIKGDLYATALCFRLLRQYGYHVSQDMFMGCMDENGKFLESKERNVKAMVELFEASHLGSQDENILDEARVFTTEYLKNVRSDVDDTSSKMLETALGLPLQRRAEWYNVRRNIQVYEKEENANSVLLKLAKLNFNIVQAAHQEDLKELSRWWRNLGVLDKLSFTRDRVVESFLWSVGVAFEPQYGNFRKWLTKAIKLVLIIDDIYDIYGSLEELEQFTTAVDRWDFRYVEELPECMKIVFKLLYDTANETASDIQKEKGWNSVLSHIHKVWVNFCKALLTEARWDNQGYTPSLKEYLDNGWISSCGEMLAHHAFFSVTNEATEEAIDLLKNCDELVHCTSLIIRLCNDQGTSAAELERGDAPSSILCYMREANVSEDVARRHIQDTIDSTWKKINTESINQAPLMQPFIKCAINTARVSHFIYQNGDGFGVQDRETRQQVLSYLIEPLPLS